MEAPNFLNPFSIVMTKFSGNQLEHEHHC